MYMQRCPVISFHGQIVPSQIVPQNSQFFPQKSQFVSHMLYLFSKCVNVIRVQTSDRNMDESSFRTIYIMLRALYVNFTMHCGTWLVEIVSCLFSNDMGFGWIVILSACGMNETFFFSIKFNQQV